MFRILLAPLLVFASIGLGCAVSIPNAQNQSDASVKSDAGTLAGVAKASPQPAADDQPNTASPSAANAESLATSSAAAAASSVYAGKTASIGAVLPFAEGTPESFALGFFWKTEDRAEHVLWAGEKIKVAYKIYEISPKNQSGVTRGTLLAEGTAELAHEVETIPINLDAEKALKVRSAVICEFEATMPDGRVLKGEGKASLIGR